MYKSMYPDGRLLLRYNDLMREERAARIAAYLIVLATAILSATQWPVLPYFLDSYYHLSVIQGFQEAGGLVLHAFWEAAPEGRPHLYPPVFHLVFLPVLQAGADPIFLARFWSWAAMPTLLAVAWVAASRVFSPLSACLILVALAIPYSFFLSTVNYLPATGTLVCTLGILLALFKGRWIAGGILLGFAFWLHAGLPWLMAFGLFLFALIEPSYRKTTVRTLLLGILLGAPWFLHTLKYLELIQLQPRGEERFLEFPVILLALGATGFFLCVKRGGLFRFLACLGLGFLPMLAGYRFRFFAAQGLFPWLLLAGLALERLVQYFRRPGRTSLLAGTLLALVGLMIGSPTLFVSNEGVRWTWADTTFAQLAGWTKTSSRATAQTIFNRKFMSELASQVEAQTGPDELIYSDFPYLSGMMSVLTRRATTNRMLREMQGPDQGQEIQQAKLILWLKEPEGKTPRGLREVVERFGLIPSGETEIAYLFQNPSATGRRRVVKALLPGWLAVGVMLLASGVVLWDLKRRPGA